MIYSAIPAEERTRAGLGVCANEEIADDVLSGLDGSATSRANKVVGATARRTIKALATAAQAAPKSRRGKRQGLPRSGLQRDTCYNEEGVERCLVDEMHSKLGVDSLPNNQRARCQRCFKRLLTGTGSFGLSRDQEVQENVRIHGCNHRPRISSTTSSVDRPARWRRNPRYSANGEGLGTFWRIIWPSISTNWTSSPGRSPSRLLVDCGTVTWPFAVTLEVGNACTSFH